MRFHHVLLLMSAGWAGHDPRDDGFVRPAAYQAGSGGLVARWLGQDGHDFVGPHGRLEPSEVQDIHLALSGLDPRREVESVEVTADEGGRWRSPSQDPWWRVELKRQGRSRTADLYLEPSRAETGRAYHLVVRYQGGAVGETDLRGRRADPNQMMPLESAKARWLGQDGQDWIGAKPVVGPDGLVDAHVRLERLSVRFPIQAITIEGPSRSLWEYGQNPKLLAPAELVRDAQDASRGDLYFQPTKDLAGQRLRLTIAYENGRIDKIQVAAGRIEPAKAMPVKPLPKVVVQKLSVAWAGQDGRGERPGDVHVTVDGLPSQGVRAAILTDSVRGVWEYRGKDRLPPVADPRARPLIWRASTVRGSADLYFEPSRDETGNELDLILFLADGRLITAKVPGGACDPARIHPEPAALSVRARPGEDLQALVDRNGRVELAPGVYRLSRPLNLAKATTLDAPGGATLLFNQGAGEPPWSAAIKIREGETTLSGFSVRFEGPVRWNNDVSWGPAVIGMADNFDHVPDELPGAVVFRRLDLEIPPVPTTGGWAEAPRLIRLVRAQQGVIEGNILRGGTIEFFGGPWRVVDNDFRGTPPGTISHSVFTGHGVHDVLVRGNRARAQGPSGKTWRFLVFTGVGAFDVVEQNTIADLGARDDDTIPWSNEPEIILTEGYHLKYEGSLMALSSDGRIARIGRPQGDNPWTGDLITLLSGPAAGEFRRVALALDPTTILVDAPIPEGTLAVSIASGFYKERFAENRIDIRGGARSDGMVLVGNHFGTSVLKNQFLGGGHAFRITACPTEHPMDWGWSHAPFVGGVIAGNLLEDNERGGVLGVEHDPKHMRSNQGRTYMTIRLDDNLVRYTEAFLSRGTARSEPLVGITLGHQPTHDPLEFRVMAHGNRLERPPGGGAIAPLLIRGALYNSTRIVNRRLDFTDRESALRPERTGRAPATTR